MRTEKATKEEESKATTSNIDRVLQKQKRLKEPKENPLLVKAHKINQRHVAFLQYCYSVLRNAANHVSDMADWVRHADEFELLHLAGLTRKQVAAYNRRLARDKKAVESAAKAIMGRNKARWTRIEYDPFDSEAHIPF